MYGGIYQTHAVPKLTHSLNSQQAHSKGCKGLARYRIRVPVDTFFSSVRGRGLSGEEGQLESTF